MSSLSASWLEDCARAVETAVLDHSLWPSALRTIRQRFDAAAAAIEFWDHRQANGWSFISDGFDEGGLVELKGLYPETNPRLDENRDIAAREITYDYKYRTEAELERCGYIRDIESLTGTRYYLAGVPLRDSTHYAGISLFHERGQGHFTEQQAQALQSLMPILAIGLRSTLISRGHRLLASLASSSGPDTAIVLVDCRGHPLTTNPLADHIFGAENGSFMGAPRVRKVVAAALRGTTSACRWSSPRDGRDYDVVGIPVTTDMHDFASLEPRAALLIHDPQARYRLLPEAVRDLYGLSRREIEVCEALLAGWGPDDIARRLGIAESTVRVHLRSILMKTEVHSQVELVARLRPLLVGTGENPRTT